MKKTVTSHKPINQSQLKRLLKLSPNEIRYLKQKNILKYQRVGTEDIFDETSVKSFMDFFNRNDYLTVGECRKILVKWNFYTYRDPQIRFYYFPLGFYVSVKSLINRNPDIPSEYQLHPIKFGTTQYISRKEFAKTLNWMRHINQKLHPKISNTQNFAPLVKKPKVKGLNGTKRIRSKKQPTFRSSVIPSMVCPLSPLSP
jgi:hypothetical protein